MQNLTNSEFSLPLSYAKTAESLGISKMLLDIHKGVRMLGLREGLMREDRITIILNALRRADANELASLLIAVSEGAVQAALGKPGEKVFRAASSLELMESLAHALSMNIDHRAKSDQNFNCRLKTAPALALWDIQSNFLQWVLTGYDDQHIDGELNKISAIDSLSDSARQVLCMPLISSIEAVSCAISTYLEIHSVSPSTSIN